MAYSLPLSKRTQEPQWSDMPTELLEVIFSKLSFVNRSRFKSVCSSWRIAGKSFSLMNHQPLKTPFLILPPKQDEDGICLYSLEDNRVYEFNNAPKDLKESRCVGSSHGWLILQDKEADPYLLNLFSQNRIIKLPPKETIPHFNSVKRKKDNVINQVEVEYTYDFPSSQTMSFEFFQKQVMIQKAVLSSNPYCDDSYAVVITYSMQSKVGFWRKGNSKWKDLQGHHKLYTDILCFNNKLYALGGEGSIEIWDFNNENCSPVKTTNFRPSSSDLEPSRYFNRELFSTNCYLVESRGDILLLMRYIGEFVRNGEPVYQDDLLTDEDTHPLICPYQTLDFRVYKINFDKRKLSMVESLGDRALFLGANHSVSVSDEEHSECKGNSIYFTDNYWDRIDEDYCYGGHDMGVFSLDGKHIDQVFYDGVELRIEPPPFWVFG